MLLLRTMAWVMYTWSTARTRKRCNVREVLSIKLKKLERPSHVANTYNNMAIVYKKQGKYDEALAMYERPVDLIEEIGDDHPGVATTYNNMANVYRKQGKYDEALAMYEKACRSN